MTALVEPYAPYGSAAALFRAKDPEVLLSGPAGTGKSRACLEKLYLCALKYSGMRALIVRKTRASLTQTGLITFERKVLPPGSRVKRNTTTDSYKLPNGSEIVCAGLDNEVRIMSTEYDMVFVQEATELTESDWESLTTRLRNNVMPYQQLIADCNPSHPKHWLKQRCDRGHCRLIACTHQDNPTLWDRTREAWTRLGQTYLATLDRLTGVRALRLKDGKWAASEGMVYKDWDDQVHVIDPFEIPADWRRIRVIDFGFTNPFVCQWWAVDGDNRMYRYREIYMTQRLVEDHARQIKEVEGEGETIEATICDHDAEDRATLERHLGCDTLAAHKAVSEGIQANQARLRVQKDGRARVFFFRDALVEVDTGLEERKLPLSTVDEAPGYEWAKSNTGTSKEAPVKQNDHGMDTWRYATAYVDELGEQKAFHFGVVS